MQASAKLKQVGSAGTSRLPTSFPNRVFLSWSFGWEVTWERVHFVRPDRVSLGVSAPVPQSPTSFCAFVMLSPIPLFIILTFHGYYCCTSLWVLHPTVACSVQRISFCRPFFVWTLLSRYGLCFHSLLRRFTMIYFILSLVAACMLWLCFASLVVCWLLRRFCYTCPLLDAVDCCRSQSTVYS